jgi:hypothetical protein
MSTMDLGLAAGLIGMPLLAGSWAWLLRREPTFPDWRSRAGVASLVCATAAEILGLMLAIILHLGLASVSEFYFRSLVAMGLLSLIGIVLGAVSKGSPRLVGTVWSFIVFAAFYFTLGTSGH